MDPRTMRTRQLIIDAFNQLIATKDFNQITIKEITELATINRATFYAHFLDKYELLDLVLTEQMASLMTEHFSAYKTLDVHVIVHLFQALTHVHDTLHTHCRRGYNTFTKMIEDKAKQQLKTIFTPLVQNDLTATLLSWALYGSYYEWDQHRSIPATDYAQTVALALLKLAHK